MNRDEIYACMKRATFWVQASVADGGGPQAAVIGVAVSDEGWLVFDTFSSSRKCASLRRDPRIALVMWDGAVTVQLEGVCDEPSGAALADAKRVYFAKFADGPTREHLPEITYFRVRPAWVRHTDFSGDVPRETVLRFDASV